MFIIDYYMDKLHWNRIHWTKPLNCIAGSVTMRLHKRILELAKMNR